MCSEMIITIPTDADGSAGADGAEYRGLEISDGDELWIFNVLKTVMLMPRQLL